MDNKHTNAKLATQAALNVCINSRRRYSAAASFQETLISSKEGPVAPSIECDRLWSPRTLPCSHLLSRRAESRSPWLCQPRIYNAVHAPVLSEMSPSRLLVSKETLLLQVFPFPWSTLTVWKFCYVLKIFKGFTLYLSRNLHYIPPQKARQSFLQCYSWKDESAKCHLPYLISIYYHLYTRFVTTKYKIFIFIYFQIL